MLIQVEEQACQSHMTIRIQLPLASFINPSEVGRSKYHSAQLETLRGRHRPVMCEMGSKCDNNSQ